MKYLLYISVLFLFTSIYLSSCANRTVPTGGPKDTIPPNLVTVVPQNKSTNFHGSKVVLDFDEFIKIKDIKNQLIITPRLEEEYEYKINKTTLTLDLNQKLDSNTTYTFYFQEAVQDINESTPAKNLVLAFSTGAYIDSLSIEGKINDLLTNAPVENAVVALYPSNDTLDLFNSKPQYFTRTKKDGTYKIENLKNASYNIYAFVDNNKNLTAQSDSEAYGFLADSIALDTAATDINIPLVKRNVKNFGLQSARPNGVYFDVKMNKYIDDYNIKSIDKDIDTLISNFASNQSTIRFYNTFKKDSASVEINATDTIGQTYTDTIAVKFPNTQRKPDAIKVNIVPASGTIEPNFTATISFNKPMEQLNLDSAFIYYDSLTLDTIQQRDLMWNKFRDQLTIAKNLDPKLLEKKTTPTDPLLENLSSPDTVVEDSLRIPSREMRQKEAAKPKGKFDKSPNQVILYIAPGNFVSIEKDTVPAITATYTFKKNEDMGIIKGTVNTQYENFSIQLLNKSFDLVEEVKGRKRFSFDLIPPGEYRLRILVDSNSDGTWSPGNILENEPPEPVFFYGEPVIIRANWERELDPMEF